jgi:hypothetical protein
MPYVSELDVVTVNLLEVVVGRPRADDGWTLVQAKTRHARMVTDGNPDSMTGSKKKSNPMNANGVGNGVGILRQSTTGLKRLNQRVNWMNNGIGP